MAAVQLSQLELTAQRPTDAGHEAAGIGVCLLWPGFSLLSPTFLPLGVGVFILCIVSCNYAVPFRFLLRLTGKEFALCFKRYFGLWNSARAVKTFCVMRDGPGAFVGPTKEMYGIKWKYLLWTYVLSMWSVDCVALWLWGL